MSRIRAVAFDFNGTLSRDEPILFAVYRELFAEHGCPLSPDDYYGALAGLPAERIIGTWLGVEGKSRAALVEERSERYLELCGDGASVSPAVRAAVAYAAARVPVAVVSGAFRREIEPVLAAAGLAECVQVIVAVEDGPSGKASPGRLPPRRRATRPRAPPSRCRRLRGHGDRSLRRQSGGTALRRRARNEPTGPTPRGRRDRRGDRRRGRREDAQPRYAAAPRLKSPRAITSRWISLVPSQIRSTRSSR